MKSILKEIVTTLLKVMVLVLLIVTFFNGGMYTVGLIVSSLALWVIGDL